MLKWICYVRICNDRNQETKLKKMYECENVLVHRTHYITGSKSNKKIKIKK